MNNLKKKLKYLYESGDAPALKFRYGLLAFDIAILGYLIFSSFHYGNPIIEIIDLLVGFFVMLDFIARFLIRKSQKQFWFNLFTIADLLVMLSLLLPMMGENAAFLRVIRAMRLFRSYHLLENIKRCSSFFNEYHDVINSSINLFVFIFVMTAVVFETQVLINPGINNYLDALYFTVATLTTTGFGDVVLEGSGGRFVAVLIMIFGVSLFIRLIQTTYRPFKVRYVCENCGLYLHDRDAIKCKHCGNTLAIPDDGLD
ncbi:MAG: potassium channel family protein [Rickettsiales bacterium]